MPLTTITKLGSIGTLAMLMTTQAYAAPQYGGSWGPVFDWTFFSPGHAILTPQGNLLTLGQVANSSDVILDVWSPELGIGEDSHYTLSSAFSDGPTDTSGSSVGSAILIPETGNILITGIKAFGEETDATYIFNTQTNSLSRAADMKTKSRLYAASTILPNGEIILNGEIVVDDSNPEQLPEIYSPSTNQWRYLSGASLASVPYTNTNDMTQWITPNGKLFGYGGRYIPSSFSRDKMFTMDLEGNGSLTTYENSFSLTSSLGGESVMYRPGTIFSPFGDLLDNPTPPWVIDMTEQVPYVREVTVPRESEVNYSSNPMMLPNGKVMALSRFTDYQNLEIWDPSSEAWTEMARLPGSSLLTGLSNIVLLKDGTILVLGNGGFYFTEKAKIFSPPYLFNSSGQLAERPVIISAPVEAAYGQTVGVKSGPSNTISRVTLIKTSRLERRKSTGSRFIELTFDDTDTGVNVKLPNSPNAAPPGHYIMYLLDSAGVPSEGHIISLSGSSQNTVYPTATADYVTATGSGQITIDALANDSGSDLTLNAPNAWSLKGGNVALVGNKITYKPKAGFNGEDKIWYTFRDSQGRTNSGVIIITVSGNNGSSSPYPTSAQDNVTTTTATSITIDVLANDTGDGLSLNTPNAWSLNGGTVSLVSNKLVYQSKAGFTGSDNIWYTFKDSQGRGNSGQVNITVNSGGGSSAYPVANADYYTTAKNTGQNLNILANDTGGDYVAIDTLYEYTAKGGTSYKTPQGQVWYTPKAGFTGEDNFWYVMVDSEGRKNSAQVKITVTQ